MEEADSFAVNPHKLMMVPIDCSLFYTRHPTTLREAFSLEAEYLKTGSDALDYRDYGLALGRQVAAWLGARIEADERFEQAAPVTPRPGG